MDHINAVSEELLALKLEIEKLMRENESQHHTIEFSKRKISRLERNNDLLKRDLDSVEYELVKYKSSEYNYSRDIHCVRDELIRVLSVLPYEYTIVTDALTLKQLHDIAFARGIEWDGLNKTELIKLINEASQLTSQSH
jgi:hypothetical protein